MHLPSNSPFVLPSALSAVSDVQEPTQPSLESWSSPQEWETITHG